MYVFLCNILLKIKINFYTYRTKNNRIIDNSWLTIQITVKFSDDGKTSIYDFWTGYITIAFIIDRILYLTYLYFKINWFFGAYVNIENNIWSVLFTCEFHGCFGIFDDLLFSDLTMTPILLYLQTPPKWDKSSFITIFNHLASAFTNSEANIRILSCATDELEIFAKIAKSILKDVNLTANDVTNILSEVLSKADINTCEEAQIDVSVHSTADNTQGKYIQHAKLPFI